MTRDVRPEERCTYCCGVFPAPIGLHHSEDACCAAGVEALVAEAVTAERERIAAWLDDRADVILRHHGGLYYEPIQTLRTAAKDVRSGVSHGSGDETVNDD